MILRACLLTAVAALAVGAGGCANEIDCTSYKFSPLEWRTAEKRLERRDDASALAARRRAADALVKCRLLARKTKRQVRRLLGGPDMRLREENAWAYAIGRERGPFSVDEEVLMVTFKRGRVFKVRTEVW